MAFRKLVGSYKDYNLATHIIEDGYLAVDVDTGSLRIGDGSTPGGTVIAPLGGGGGGASLGDLTAVGSTLTSPSDGDLTFKTSGTGVVLIDDTFKIGSGVGVTTILDEDNMASDSATALATQQSIKAYVDAIPNEFSFKTIAVSGQSNVVADNTTDTLTLVAGSNMTITTSAGGDSITFASSGGGGGGSTGDVSFVGATISAPSNAPLTLMSSGSSVDIEGISIAGTVLSTTDSSIGIEITGNLIPSADGVYQLGSASRRWQTAYLSAGTLDIGGATISSDGTGSITIAATGATLPSGSKVVNQAIMLGGLTPTTAIRPIQLVPIFVSDGSTTKTDAQLLAGSSDLDLEFNGTIEEVPIYTEAQQTFTLSNGTSLNNQYTANITQFQF